MEMWEQIRWSKKASDYNGKSNDKSVNQNSHPQILFITYARK